MLAHVIVLLLMLLVPYLSLRVLQLPRLRTWLSPVVICYGVGIVVANWSGLGVPETFTTAISQGTILVAIPLLLFSTDLRGWARYAKSIIIAFSLVIAAGVLVSLVAGILARKVIPDVEITTAMLTGIFTGGVPNLQAVGLALRAPEELFIVLNVADIFVGGLLLILLTSVVHPLLRNWLPEFPQAARALSFDVGPTDFRDDPWYVPDLMKALLLVIAILTITLGSTYGLFGNFGATAFIMLLLTTLSVLASFRAEVRQWRGTSRLGDYILLMFCVALGLLADFTDIWSKGGALILYTGAIMYSTFGLHLLLCRWWKIDRDTALITATAALYGPVFIGQVASAINNRTLVFSGMMTGLVGYAIGNYLGIGVGYALMWLLQ